MCLRSGNWLGYSLNERAACFLLHWALLFLDGGAPILGDLPSVNTPSPWLQCQTGWFTALNMMYELWREEHAHALKRVNLKSISEIGGFTVLICAICSPGKENWSVCCHYTELKYILNKEVICTEPKFVNVNSEFTLGTGVLFLFKHWRSWSGHALVADLSMVPYLQLGTTPWFLDRY